jgi:hypothetical protein
MKCGVNRGVNAIFHAGTDTGTIRNSVFIFFIFNSYESLGGNQSEPMAEWVGLRDGCVR